MPELPEIKITCEIIRKIVLGAYLDSITIVSGRYIKSAPKGYASFIKDTPAKIINVDSKGKLLYFILKGASGNTWTILNTFGLTGEWNTGPDKFTRLHFRIQRANKIKIDGQENVSITSEKIPHSPLNFKVSEKTIKDLYYQDMRNFGTFIFLSDPNQKLLLKKLKTLGVDPILDDFTPSVIISKINAIKKQISIYEFLMNQKYISGIGNYLSQEILYYSKISPLRKINTLTRTEVTRLYKAILYKIKQSYVSQGGEYNYLPKVKVKGTFTFEVYGKKECPIGHILKSNSEVIKGRTVRWCPVEQF